MEDLFYKLHTHYQNLPCGPRNVLGVILSALPARIRYGSFYGQYRERIRRFSECPSMAQVQSAQLELLQETVRYAVQHVPFYREYGPLRAVEDLQGFPIVDKQILRERRSEFVATAFRKCALTANTGGSSGSPLSFYIHRGLTRPKEKAHFDWFWGQFGYDHGARVLMVRGRALRRNALYEYQALANRLAVSCHAVNAGNIEEVLKAVCEFQPRFIYGYPSAVAILTRLIGDPHRLLDHVGIEALFLGSEGISPADRAYLNEFYGSRVVSWYGHSECAVHAGNALDSDEYHFYPFYGYVELLDGSGCPVTRPGDRGRIVTTSFDNFVMPFIRYDTGDIGILSDRSTWCDRVPCTVLRQIEGRSQDYVVLQDGTCVSATAFIGSQLHSPQFSVIREMQLQQDKRGELLVRVVPLSTIRPEGIEHMRRVLRESVSAQLSITFEIVEGIAKTARGKHRFFIQNLAEDVRYRCI